MEVYFLRIGETQANANSKLSNDSELTRLTDKGRKQIKKTSQRLNNENIDSIFCSTLQGSLESAKTFITNGKVEQKTFHSMEDFREVDWGDWEGMEKSRLEQEFPVEYNSFWQGKSDIIPNGKEKLLDVANRMENGLIKIHHQFPNGTVVIIGHGASSRILICHLKRKPLIEFVNIRGENACLTKFTYTPNKKVTFDFISCTSHLMDEEIKHPLIKNYKINNNKN